MLSTLVYGNREYPSIVYLLEKRYYFLQLTFRYKNCNVWLEEKTNLRFIK
jgi:hypothetical protein